MKNRKRYVQMNAIITAKGLLLSVYLARKRNQIKFDVIVLFLHILLLFTRVGGFSEVNKSDR